MGKQSPKKSFSDTSYLDNMMETVTTSQIDGLLSEKPTTHKSPGKSDPIHKKSPMLIKPISKSKSTTHAWRDTIYSKGPKIDWTIHPSSKKAPTSIFKILSPNSRPPIVSPSATRSGVRFGK